MAGVKWWKAFCRRHFKIDLHQQQRFLLWFNLIEVWSRGSSSQLVIIGSNKCLMSPRRNPLHYNDVIMGAIASQITSITSVYSIIHSDSDQRKHQSSASLTFVRGIHRGPVNSPHKWPVTRKCFHLMTSSWRESKTTQFTDAKLHRSPSQNLVIAAMSELGFHEYFSSLTEMINHDIYTHTHTHIYIYIVMISQMIAVLTNNKWTETKHSTSP